MLTTAPTAEILAAIFAAHAGQKLRVVYIKEGATAGRAIAGASVTGET